MVPDEVAGPVRLTGRFHRHPGSTAAVVAVHGLGGNAQSHYMLRGAAAAARLGLSYLRLNLRGADRQGQDFYHAGQTVDLEAALASPQLASFERLYLVGFSLGGHTVLRWALDCFDPRVRAAAAICSPLDLGSSSRSFSRVSRWPYRLYILGALHEMYRAVAERSGSPAQTPIPVAEAERIWTLEEWDEKVVAPRHGFAGAEDYYRRSSVAPGLEELRLPSLWVGSGADPMVEAHTVREHLEGTPDSLTVCWTPRGGHMGFPRSLQLGLSPRPGLEDQVLGWLADR